MVRATETFKPQMLEFDGKNINIIKRNKPNIYQKNNQPAKYNNTLTFNNLPRLLPKLLSFRH